MRRLLVVVAVLAATIMLGVISGGGGTAVAGDTPTYECNDHLNNDPQEDGNIDFPYDSGCDSYTDDSEYEGDPANANASESHTQPDYVNPPSATSPNETRIRCSGAGSAIYVGIDHAIYYGANTNCYYFPGGGDAWMSRISHTTCLSRAQVLPSPGPWQTVYCTPRQDAIGTFRIVTNGTYHCVVPPSGYRFQWQMSVTSSGRAPWGQENGTLGVGSMDVPIRCS